MHQLGVFVTCDVDFFEDICFADVAVMFAVRAILFVKVDVVGVFYLGGCWVIVWVFCLMSRFYGCFFISRTLFRIEILQVNQEFNIDFGDGSGMILYLLVQAHGTFRN